MKMVLKIKATVHIFSESYSLNASVFFIQIFHTHLLEYSPPDERIKLSVSVYQLKRLCQFQLKWSSKSKSQYTFLSESYSLNPLIYLIRFWIRILHTHLLDYSPPGEGIELSVAFCQLKRLCLFQWNYSQNQNHSTCFYQSATAETLGSFWFKLDTQIPLGIFHLLKG